VQVPLGANLRDDFYHSTGMYSSCEYYVEGLTAGAVELTPRLERGATICEDRVLVNVVEYRIVELRYQTFIACSAVGTGSIPIFVSDWFEGDDRDFGYNAASSRSFQSYYVTVGPTMPEGSVIAVAADEGFGPTAGYNDEAANVAPCPPGQVCPGFCTTCILPGATPDCTGLAVAGANGNVQSGAFERLNTAHGEFRLDLVGKNPCVSGAPAIDAHLIFVFRQQYNPDTGILGPMEWRIDPGDPSDPSDDGSWHDEFPWHELYFNGVQVYTFDPCIHPGGPDPENLVDDDFGVDSDINLPDDNQPQNPNIESWQEVP